MDQATHSKIVSFIWGIADDVLRDLFKRGKYPDVILPMCVLRCRLMDDERLKQSRTAWRKPSIISPLLVTEQRKAWPTPAGRRAYFLSRIEYLFSIAISLDAASGIFAPLPRICLLVQRWP